jgi:hypothetical protein
MAPLPSNNTAVLFVDYSVAGEQHTVQVRYSASSSVAAAMAWLDDFLVATSPFLFLTTIVAARNRAQGSNLSFPVTWTGASTYGSGAGEHFNSAWYIDYIGRSPLGRRVRIGMFGTNVVTDAVSDDYRLQEAENVNVANTLTALEASPTEGIAIDGGNPVWNRYANIGVNAYWRNRIRG